MSRENVRILRGVRIPLRLSGKGRSRSLNEQIAVRFPMLFRLVALVWSRLPLRSRLRRVLTAYLFRQGYEAANRRDFDVLLLSLDPEIEFHFDEIAATVDLLGVHHGHDGYVRVWQALMDAMEDIRLEPEEVIDFGDRLLASGRWTGHGTSSGLPIDEPLFQLFTMRRGLVIRQTDFTDRDKALEAAGLRE